MSARLSPFIHPFMHFNLVSFYFRNVVSEKKDDDVQIESKYKGLRLGIKVSEKDMWSGQWEKNPLEMGVQQGSQDTQDCQQLPPAPWPCKRLNPLSDHHPGNPPVFLQNNIP